MCTFISNVYILRFKLWLYPIRTPYMVGAVCLLCKIHFIFRDTDETRECWLLLPDAVRRKRNRLKFKNLRETRVDFPTNHPRFIDWILWLWHSVSCTYYVEVSRSKLKNVKKKFYICMHVLYYGLYAYVVYI